MSIYDKDLLSGKNKVETAIERIRTYCVKKNTLVAFSGGKSVLLSPCQDGWHRFFSAIFHYSI